MPRVRVVKSLRALLRELGDAPPGARTRFVCHPQRDGGPRVPALAEAAAAAPPGSRLLLAVGPDGGWEEPEEIELLAEHGFEQVTLGKRTLRTEVAVVALLAVAHSHIDAPC